MRTRQIWWIGLLAFFLISAAWAVATPYNGAYDEHDHVVRAAGVVRGQVLVTPARGVNDGGYPVVPRSLVPPNATCMMIVNPPPASCLGTPPDDRSAAPVHSRAARYNPAYYAIVGWPLLPWPTMGGVIAARLLSALLCAALLATAWTLALSLKQRRFLPLAVLFAASPMLTALDALVNPSGLAITAAVLLWVVLLRRYGDDEEPDEPVRRRLAWVGALAGALVVLSRPEGFVLVGAVVAVAWVALGVPRPRRIPPAALIVAGATALALGWSWISRVAEFGAAPTPVDAPMRNILRTIVESNIDYWMRQTIALFGYGTIGLPLWLYLAWAAVLGGLLAAGFVRAGRRTALVIAGIPLVCVAGGIAADLVMSGIVGYWMQGRYFLPLWAGAFLLAAWAIGDVGDRPLVHRSYAAAVTVWALVHTASLTIGIIGYAAGRRPRPAGSPPTVLEWLPPGGIAVPAALLLLGIVAAAVLTGRSLRPPAPAPPRVTPLPETVDVAA
ncbi:DUF2142 domain-containing protein [Dactylosporangium sucinum]|uniref:DUF2142 domain-containing protein n=1 Tax=Dactylosporangium sucinum TaxID=1424081 RepID=A0A917WVL2_9ACTN|nr:DUF2142 domain-containing protein [Dactylosporangium sucinum]GGM33008.1 hypothetical protein GCM10007977_037970 [Dactylosporangium sucinum]